MLFHRLISDWRECNFDAPPYFFTGDECEIETKEKVSLYQSFDDYISSPIFGLADTSLHIGLIPIPYIGNLENATIFILMLNPGLSTGDYFAEQNNAEYRKALIRNVYQENAGDEYPFIFLDPHLAWHPGFKYWQGKFHSITAALAKQENVTYQNALSRLAKQIACLELMPYRSKSFHSDRLLKTLPSTKTMINFVREVVIPKVQNDEAIIIATRKVEHWVLPEHQNIVIYEGGETRSAHLTIKTRGGKAIAQRLGVRL